MCEALSPFLRAASAGKAGILNEKLSSYLLREELRESIFAVDFTTNLVLERRNESDAS